MSVKGKEFEEESGEMNTIEMMQTVVDGKTVRDRIHGFEYRLNGEALERRLPDEDGFKQISIHGANIRERVQKLLDGETIVADKGVKLCIRDSRFEMRFPCDKFLFRDVFPSPPKSSPFDPDDEDYYIREPFNTLADVWDIVEGEE